RVRGRPARARLPPAARPVPRRDRAPRDRRRRDRPRRRASPGDRCARQAPRLHLRRARPRRLSLRLAERSRQAREVGVKLAVVALLVCATASADTSKAKKDVALAAKSTTHGPSPRPGTRPVAIVNLYNEWTKEWLAVDPKVGVPAKVA